jgi:hypothetical protein
MAHGPILFLRPDRRAADTISAHWSPLLQRDGESELSRRPRPKGYRNRDTPLRNGAGNHFAAKVRRNNLRQDSGRGTKGRKDQRYANRAPRPPSPARHKDDAGRHSRQNARKVAAVLPGYRGTQPESVPCETENPSSPSLNDSNRKEIVGTRIPKTRQTAASASIAPITGEGKNRFRGYHRLFRSSIQWEFSRSGEKTAGKKKTHVQVPCPAGSNREKSPERA